VEGVRRTLIDWEHACKPESHQARSAILAGKALCEWKLESLEDAERTLAKWLEALLARGVPPSVRLSSLLTRERGFPSGDLELQTEQFQTSSFAFGWMTSMKGQGGREFVLDLGPYVDWLLAVSATSEEPVTAIAASTFAHALWAGGGGYPKGALPPAATRMLDQSGLNRWRGTDTAPTRAEFAQLMPEMTAAGVLGAEDWVWAMATLQRDPGKSDDSRWIEWSIHSEVIGRFGGTESKQVVALCDFVERLLDPAWRQRR
jgi:hypothetical protein